jgi:hypothetical protein
MSLNVKQMLPPGRAVVPRNTSLISSCAPASRKELSFKGCSYVIPTPVKLQEVPTERSRAVVTPGSIMVKAMTIINLRFRFIGF